MSEMNTQARLAAEEIRKTFGGLGAVDKLAAIISRHCPGDVATLREALEPFARMADKFDFEPYKSKYLDLTRIKEHPTVLSHCYLTLGDCRKAKAALASVPAEPQVDTTLESIAGELRTKAKRLLSDLDILPIDHAALISLADAVSAHARKSQPTQTVNERLLKDLECTTQASWI